MGTLEEESQAREGVWANLTMSVVQKYRSAGQNKNLHAWNARFIIDVINDSLKSPMTGEGAEVLTYRNKYSTVNWN